MTLLPTGVPVKEVLEATVEVNPGELRATVASAGTHWPLAFINSICLKVSPSGKGIFGPGKASPELGLIAGGLPAVTAGESALAEGGGSTGAALSIY